MKTINIKNVLLLSVFALAMGSCEDSENNNSVVSTFTVFPAENGTGAQVVEEWFSGTYTFDYTLSGESQVQDITLEIAVGGQSTATEDEDFILETHSVELAAYQGQDGFPISITVIDDGEVEPDETIYLTFTSEGPSGIDRTEQLVITIPGCTEATPEETLFVGDYQLTSTGGFPDIGGGAPVFDETVTLVYEGPEARSFDATYLGALGIGNPAQTWLINWDACGSDSFVFSQAEANLSCGPALYLIPFGTFGTGDIADDDSFTVLVSEFEDGTDGCGGDGTFGVTLTFTKL